MRRFFVVFAFAAVLQTTPAAALTRQLVVQDAGRSRLLRTKSGSFLCMTPNDGFWIRLTGIYGRTVNVQKGYAGATAGTATPS